MQSEALRLGVQQDRPPSLRMLHCKGAVPHAWPGSFLFRRASDAESDAGRQDARAASAHAGQAAPLAAGLMNAAAVLQGSFVKCAPLLSGSSAWHRDCGTSRSIRCSKHDRRSVLVL